MAELSFTTRVDLSGLNAGLNEAQDAVANTSSALQDAMAAATAATQNLGEAQIELGASAAQGNEQAAAVIAEYQAALDTASESVLQATLANQRLAESGGAVVSASRDAASAVTSAAEDSATSVVESADIQQAAYEQVAEATLQNSVAQQLLKGAYQQAKEGAIEASVAIEVLANFERIAKDATEQLALAKSNLKEVTDYLNASTEVEISETVADTAAKAGLTAANERLAASSAHTVSGMQAASGAIREFSGALPIRAVEGFISKTLGLGPILQAAFPIIGAIALGEVIFDLGEKLYKAYQDAENAGHAIEEAWRGFNETLTLSNDALSITNDKLENELLKLENKPRNGLQLALDEAKQSADQLSASLQKDIDKVNELITKNKVGIFGQLLGKVGTDDVAKMIHDPKNLGSGYSDRIEKIKNDYQDTIDSATEHGATKENITHIKEDELGRLQTVYSEAEAKLKPLLHEYQQDLDMFQESAGGRGRDTSGVVNLLRGYLLQIKAEQQALGEAFREESLKEQIAPLQAAKGPKGPQAPDENSAQLKVIEEQFSELQEKSEEIRGRGLTAGEASAYWTPFLDQFKVEAGMYRALIDQASGYEPGSDMEKKLLLEAKKLEGANAAYKKVLDEIAKETQASHKLMFSELIVSDPAAAKTFASGAQEYDQAIKAINRESKDAAVGATDMAKGLAAAQKMTEGVSIAAEKASIALERMNAESQHQKNAGGIQLQETKVQAGASLGLTDPLKELEQLRDLHQQAIAEDERYTQQKIASVEENALREEQIYATDADKKRQIEEKLNADLLALNKQLDEQKQKSQQVQLNDTVKILLQQEQKYKQFYDVLTTSFNSALLQWQTHEITAAQAFSQMLVSMEKGIEQLVLKYLEAKLFSALLALVGLTEDSGSSSNQATLATDKTVNPQIVESNAAATASIVFFTSGGDIAAALEAYGEGMLFYPLAAYEQGGVVNGSHGMPVPIMAHAGERVLSAPQTQRFESLVNSKQGGGSGSVHLNYNPTVHAYDKTGVDKMLREHMGTVHDMVRQGVKSGAIGRS